MTTLRRAAELNTGNYGAEFRSLPYDAQNLVMAAHTAHELVMMLDKLGPGEGDDPDDEEPAMQLAYQLSTAWGLWQEIEQRVAPILARELDREGILEG